MTKPADKTVDADAEYTKRLSELKRLLKPLSDTDRYSDWLDDNCLVEAFIARNPYHGPIMIACPCRRCSIWC